MRVLIVEDEASIREVMKTYLQRAGFQVEEATSGEVAILKFNDSIHLVVLDLNLPNRDGIEVCQAIRKKSKVPIIIVTARTEEIDELKGLAVGADDYLKKPFSPKVLVARVHSLLRRAERTPESAPGLTLDDEKMMAYLGGRGITLTTTQFKILRTLMQHPGKVFSREELLAATDVGERLKQAMERTIDAHIKSIRKLIEHDPQNPAYIKTVIGSGYKFSTEA